MATLIQWPISLRTNPLNGNSSNGTHTWRPTVLLISLDGLKPQYAEGENMPTLNGLLTGSDPLGSSMPRRILAAKSMIPVSPSLTFPNHWVSLMNGSKGNSDLKPCPIYFRLCKQVFYLRHMVSSPTTSTHSHRRLEKIDLSITRTHPDLGMLLGGMALLSGRN